MGDKSVIRIVSFGGGKGQARVAEAVRDIPGVQLSVIVPDTDNTGSTGGLRENYRKARGYLGDYTRCAKALTSNPKIAELLDYRFPEFGNHSLRNLTLLAAEELFGRKEGGELFHYLLRLRENGKPEGEEHCVLPATIQKAKLRVNTVGGEVEDDEVIEGLGSNPLFKPELHEIVSVKLIPLERGPVVKAYRPALNAIRKADYIVICPGSLITSISAALLPEGIKGAIMSSGAKVVLFLNLMTCTGETSGYSATRFVEWVEDMIGRECDFIVHNTQPISEETTRRYAKEEKVVVTSGEFPKNGHRLIGAPLAETTPEGILYHCSSEIRKVLTKIIAV
ncbi:MAG TPA: 2-phospho-L-lactate transferase CofD family protein [Candidatus Paceibacterota bacterium]|nr:2-phospho-L-lactate transferase CofD family protein [Candidatus Paceibacterota bacterium]